ncbi:MAG: hypothetical protein ACOCV1_03120 [Bacillota bacterium]
MIDYDNSSFEEVWDYEYEEGLERRGVFSNFLSAGKFYDDINDFIYYMKNGEYHREDGPAIIYRRGFSYMAHFVWYNHGKEHRIDGPALYIFNENDKIVNRQYFIFGEQVSEKDISSLRDLGNGNELVILW